MLKKTKIEKDLEKFINHKTKKHYNEEQTSVLLNNKRERPIDSSSVNITEASSNKEGVNDNKQKMSLSELESKIFIIADKQKSIVKCQKLIQLIIIKYLQESNALASIVSLLEKVNKTDYKVSDIINNRNTYSELYKYTRKLLDDNDLLPGTEDEFLLKHFDLLEIPFVLMSNLITDDSFEFNAISKRLYDILLSLPDYSPEESNHIDKSKESLLNNIKRNYIVQCFDIFPKSKPQLKTSIKQLCSKIMLNKTKLSPEHLKHFNDIMKQIRDNTTNGHSLQTIDRKIKSTPLESYHEVADGREEKYIISNMSKWESKQNGIESTKQYYG